MTEKKETWPLNTKLVFTSTLGEKWPARVVKVEGAWRRVQWEDNGRYTWFPVERLNSNAVRVNKPRVRKSKVKAALDELTREAAQDGSYDEPAANVFTETR